MHTLVKKLFSDFKTKTNNKKKSKIKIKLSPVNVSYSMLVLFRHHTKSKKDSTKQRIQKDYILV